MRQQLKCYNFLGLLRHHPIATSFLGPFSKFQEFLLNVSQSRNVGLNSVGTKTEIWEKSTQSFLQEGLNI